LRETLVLKIGGSTLSDEDSIRKATQVIEGVVENGFLVAIVVSALKGVTDELLSNSKKENPSASPSDLDKVLSEGEKRSAKLLTEALEQRSLAAVAIDPDSPNWPIMTDAKHLDANPLYDETRIKVQELIRPLLDAGKLPVICGFLGKSPSGAVTTMGRGGSDTTAILIGSCLKAKEVILLKDVDTIFSSDPDKVENAVPLESLDSDEAYALASGGAKFLHAKALRYTGKGVRIRIASMANNIFQGTVIDGGEVDLKIERSNESISMITIIGAMTVRGDHLRTLLDRIEEAGGKVISLTHDSTAMIAYVSGGDNILNRVHDFVIGEKFGKAVSDFGDLAMISVSGRALETTSGMVQRVTQPLAREGINVYGVVTIVSSIRIFVSKDQASKAITLLDKALAVL